MEKLTQLNSVYIAAYAPYSLQIYYEGTNGNINSMGDNIIDDPDYIGKVLRLNLDNNTVYCEDDGIGLELEICNIKPIVRPLSDLLNPEFRQIAHDLGADIDYEAAVYDIQRGWTKQHLYEILLQNHFDTRGLIDAGLAVDVNTLNK